MVGVYGTSGNPDPLWQNTFHVTFLPVPTPSLGSISFPNQLSLLLQVCVSNQFLEDTDPGNPLEGLLNLGNIEYQQCLFSSMCTFFLYLFLLFSRKTGFLHVALAWNSIDQGGLQLTEIPLPLPSQCWD